MMIPRNKTHKTIQIILILLMGNFLNIFAQPGAARSYIREMKWGNDYKIYLELSNDSGFVLNVKNLYHGATTTSEEKKDAYTYYPVSLSNDFIARLKEAEKNTDTTNRLLSTPRNETLWGTLHASLGGGWGHFINCLVYSLESGRLNPSGPLMKRPESNWKPNPITESYRRTRRWKYYIPLDQKLAQKEYAKRKKENDLADLQGVPEPFVNLFLNTSRHDLKAMKKGGKSSEIAKINLVKLLLGARYLGSAQISYTKTMVLKSAMEFSVYKLPSIIIFDELHAAVAMSLDEMGYRIDRVVFSDEENVPTENLEERRKLIDSFVEGINKENRKMYQKKLNNLYN